MSQNNTYIADKHLEVVVRQMFSRVRIVDAGDSEFVDGEFISKPVLAAANQQLLADDKRPATWSQLVLGIAKISGLSDSFLTAACFQNTTQVLVRSAILGRVDKLQGLTENVILGRKIPIGTGAVVAGDSQPDEDQDPDSGPEADDSEPAAAAEEAAAND